MVSLKLLSPLFSQDFLSDYLSFTNASMSRLLSAYVLWLIDGVSVWHVYGVVERKLYFGTGFFFLHFFFFGHCEIDSNYLENRHSVP